MEWGSAWIGVADSQIQGGTPSHIQHVSHKNISDSLTDTIFTTPKVIQVVLSKLVDLRIANLGWGLIVKNYTQSDIKTSVWQKLYANGYSFVTN